MNNVFEIFVILGQNVFAILGLSAAALAFLYAKRKYFTDPLKTKRIGAAPVAPTSSPLPTTGSGAGKRVMQFMTEEDKKELASSVADELVNRIVRRDGGQTSMDELVNIKLNAQLLAAGFEGSVPIGVTKAANGKLVVNVRDGGDLKLVFGNGNHKAAQTPALAQKKEKEGGATFVPQGAA